MSHIWFKHTIKMFYFPIHLNLSQRKASLLSPCVAKLIFSQFILSMMVYKVHFRRLGFYSWLCCLLCDPNSPRALMSLLEIWEKNLLCLLLPKRKTTPLWSYNNPSCLSSVWFFKIIYVPGNVERWENYSSPRQRDACLLLAINLVAPPS